MMKEKHSVVLVSVLAIIYVIYVIIDLVVDFPSINIFTFISLLIIVNYAIYVIYLKLEDSFLEIGGKEISKSLILLIVYFIATAVIAYYYPWRTIIALVLSVVLAPVIFMAILYLGFLKVGGGPEAKKPVKKTKKRDDVVLGASAPQTVSPGSEFTARFLAYMPKDEAQLKDIVTQLNPKAKIHTGVQQCQWEIGTTIKVKLAGEYLTVKPTEQTFVWKGRYNIIDFDVRVVENISQKDTILKFDVLIDDIIIARLRINLVIKEKAATKKIKCVRGKAYRKAFASYASEDKEIVLHRVSEIDRNGVQVFLDCLSMRPGEDWKTTLENEIKNADIFLLFWSEHAMNSKWVTWEWKTALNYKGISGIDPHPLTTIDKAPPPEELKSLHFRDPYMHVK